MSLRNKDLCSTIHKLYNEFNEHHTIYFKDATLMFYYFNLVIQG